MAGPGHFVDNWRASDAPLSEKVRMLVKNNAIKAKNRSHCCGNHGEVGC